MNPDLYRLHSYPFEKLTELKAGLTPPSDKAHIALSIGEPKHATPAFILAEINAHLSQLSQYPLTKGTPVLREAITQWLKKRFALPVGSIDPERHVLPVSGTREALFSFAQAVIDRREQPLVMMPNPFYQIYEGAAFLAGAEPYFLNTTPENGYLPDFSAVPPSVFQRTQLLYICTPGNPTGAVMSEAALQELIALADRHDFIIASDECYSELYPDEAHPPTGLLAAAARMGRTNYERCVVFHSLSKRSNVPGLRSGFVAGDARILEDFLRYRTYHGCALSPPTQAASVAAWRDEAHVKRNRDLYREKFAAVLEILQPVMDVRAPDASFYLWARTPIDDQQFTQRLFAEQNVTVLPGSFLSRSAHGVNPGANHVRMALVASVQECVEAAHRIRDMIVTIN